MKMKRRKKTAIVLLLTLGTFFSLVATSLAWFSTIMIFNTQITGSSISNYYAGGTGAELDPYILTTPRHVYNFAWLQSNGAYPTKTYFKLGQDIDMAGELTGIDSTTSGAVPPIGNDTYPFYGDFDGDMRTISNLWVSSDPLDWKEKPLALSNITIGLSIGFFGRIGNTMVGEQELIGSAKRFYLNNVEVTTKVANSVVGIVAGVTNGNLQHIGVKNPKISLGTTSIQVKSDYSLIGEIGDKITWTDSPDAATLGNLVIDPNLPSDPFTSLTSGTRVVAGAVMDTAYYISTLTTLAINGGVSDLYKYNTTVVNTTSTVPQVISATTSSITLVTAANRTTLVSDDFYERYYATGTNKTVYFGQIAPSVNSSTQRFNNERTLTLSDNSTLTVAPNSIWFKPLRGGVSGISFLRQSQAAGVESISVYHFLRDGNLISNFGEIRFAIDKIGNKAAVYFDFEIPQAMVNDGYEFLISASTTSPATTSGFLYLSLSGTDEASGIQAAEVYGVDFVYRLAGGLFEDVSVENYVPKKTLLRFEGLFNGTICYNMYDMGATPAYDGKVYYALRSGNISVQNLISAASGGVGVATTYSTTTFPPRIET